MKGALAHQVGAFLEWRGWSPAQLAADIAKRIGGSGVTRQDIEHLIKKPVDSPRYIAALAASMGTTVETLVANRFSVPLEAATELAATAQPGISHPHKPGSVQVLYGITVPARVTWEWVVSTVELLPLFVVEMPDESLAGIVEKGVELVFEKDLPPKVGRPVLFETADGTRYVRNYAEGRGGKWRAVPTDPAFLAFDSASEPLKILASMKWRG